MPHFNRKKFIVSFFGILVALNILVWIAVFSLDTGGRLEVIFLDVGQGDSIFIKTPNNQQILIDGGPDSKVLEKLGKEVPFWDRNIDLIILTHPEKDHMAGFIEVLKRYKVENILWTGVVRDTAEYEEWIKLIGKEGADIFIAKAGQKIIAGNAELNVVYPIDNID
jgi:competence protein ComEC